MDSIAYNRAEVPVVVQVAIQKPGFFEEAGLLWAKLYYYRNEPASRLLAPQK